MATALASETITRLKRCRKCKRRKPIPGGFESKGVNRFNPECKACVKRITQSKRRKQTEAKIVRIARANNQLQIAAVCRDILDAYDTINVSFTRHVAELIRDGSPAQKQRLVLAVLKLLNHIEPDGSSVDVSVLSEGQLEALGKGLKD